MLPYIEKCKQDSLTAVLTKALKKKGCIWHGLGHFVPGQVSWQIQVLQLTSLFFAHWYTTLWQSQNNYLGSFAGKPEIEECKRTLVREMHLAPWNVDRSKVHALVHPLTASDYPGTSNIWSQEIKKSNRFSPPGPFDFS